MNVVVRSTSADIILLPRVAFYRLGLDVAFIEDLESRRDILRRTGAFSAFDEETILRLCCAANYRQCRKGTTIIRQGDIPRELCILTRGIVHAYKAANALADLGEKIRGIAEEITFLQDTFVYHASMRTRPTGGVSGTVASSAGTEGCLPEAPTDPRLVAVSKALARGGPSGAHGDYLGEAYNAATRQLRTEATLGLLTSAVGEEAGTAAGRGGSTFVEDYLRELEAKLSALQQEHVTLSRQVAASSGAAGVHTEPHVAGSARSGGLPTTTVTAPRTRFRAMVESLFPPALLSPLAIHGALHGI